MDKKVLNSMFENLLHIGNKTNYWNPKMKPSIYGSVNGIHVINLVNTYTRMEAVKTDLKALATEGKKILFVSTKLQGRDTFLKLAIATGNYYVTEKWVPGLLTNFKTIRARINTYLKLLKDSETGALDMLTKKEKATKLLELEKLDRAFKGLKEMKRVPDVIFVVDGSFEKQALKEAGSLKLKAYGILNTNGNPDMVTDYIPANTNSVNSLDLIGKYLTDTLSGIKVVRTTAPKKIEQRKANFTKRPAPKKVEQKKVEVKAKTKKEEVQKTEEKK